MVDTCVTRPPRAWCVAGPYDWESPSLGAAARSEGATEVNRSVPVLQWLRGWGTQTHTRGPESQAGSRRAATRAKQCREEWGGELRGDRCWGRGFCSVTQPGSRGRHRAPRPPALLLSPRAAPCHPPASPWVPFVSLPLPGLCAGSACVAGLGWGPPRPSWSGSHAWAPGGRRASWGHRGLGAVAGPRQASWATGTGSSHLCDPEGVPRISSFICPRGGAPAGDPHGSPSRLFLSHPIVAWGPRVQAPLLIPARPCVASPGEPLRTDCVPWPNPRETSDPMASTRSRFYAQAPASVLGLPGHPAPAGP